MDYWNLWEERMADEVYKKAHSKIRLENILYYYAMKEHVRLDALSLLVWILRQNVICIANTAFKTKELSQMNLRVSNGKKLLVI